MRQSVAQRGHLVVDVPIVLMLALATACGPTRGTEPNDLGNQVRPALALAPNSPPADQISTSGAAGELDISGDKIVWVDGRRLCTFTTLSGSIATTRREDIYLYDRATGTQQLIVQGGSSPTGSPCSDEFSFSRPRISGDLVVWRQYNPSGNSELNGLFLRDLNLGQTTLIAATGSAAAISGRRVAFHSAGDVFVYDHVTGITTRITTSGDVSDLDLDGDIVTWYPDGSLSLHWVDLADPGLTQHSLPVPGVNFVSEIHVSGQLVLFSSGNDDSDILIRVANLVTGEFGEVDRRNQTDNALIARDLSASLGIWSEFVLETGETFLFAKDVFSPALPTLIGGPEAWGARIDGTGIAFTANTGQGYDVFVAEFFQGGPPMPPPRPPPPPTPPPPPRP